MTQTVLVLGATGRFGRHCAQAFEAAGWTVRRFQRGRDDLHQAAQGAQIIVNGWHPPYPQWRRQLPGLTARVIDAARRSGATVIQPANVYVYGKDAPDVFGADTPHAATNPLGRVRIDMEAQLRDSGVPVILLRAGDFLDDAASGNWFDLQIAPSLKKGVLTWPGRDADAPHAWAWLPDLGRAAVMLADLRDGLPRFAEVNYPGYTLSAAQLAELCAQALGRDVRVRHMAWWPVRLAAPVWPTGRHLLEMSYLWSKPHRVDGTGFHALCPGFRDTPADQAVAGAVAAVMAQAS